MASSCLKVQCLVVGGVTVTSFCAVDDGDVILVSSVAVVP